MSYKDVGRYLGDGSHDLNPLILLSVLSTFSPVCDISILHAFILCLTIYLVKCLFNVVLS